MSKHLLSLFWILFCFKATPVVFCQNTTILLQPNTSGHIRFFLRNAYDFEKVNDSTYRKISLGPSRTNSLSVTVTVCEEQKEFSKSCVYVQPAVQTSPNAWIISQSKSRAADNEYDAGIAPSSLRFYMDTALLKTYGYNAFFTTTLPEKVAHTYMQPFYFSKTEVSNKEYRDFIHHICDSILRKTAGILNNKGNIDYSIKFTADSSLKIRSGLYIYNGRSGILQLNTCKILYAFHQRINEYVSDAIPVYPDTLCWIKDFSFAYNEPMSNFYFRHPAYNDYPVVGLNYWQCLAYLEWKTSETNKQLVREGKKIRVRFLLPSEREWDYVSTMQFDKEKRQPVLLGEHYGVLCDNSWLTDLRVRSSDEFSMIYLIDSTGKSIPSPYYISSASPLQSFINREVQIRHDYAYDNWFHTAPVSFEKYKLNKKQRQNIYNSFHSDASGIYFMDGNVSEWMRDDLDSSWRPAYIKHRFNGEGPESEQYKIIQQTEDFYYQQLPLHGKLVRGSNWYDERYGIKYGKNVAGMQAKTFVDPYESHSTIGFRYMIYTVAL